MIIILTPKYEEHNSKLVKDLGGMALEQYRFYNNVLIESDEEYDAMRDIKSDILLFARSRSRHACISLCNCEGLIYWLGEVLLWQSGIQLFPNAFLCHIPNKEWLENFAKS